MARLAGQHLPPEKRIEASLTFIYGIGRKLSRRILSKLNINPDTKVKDLSEKDLLSLQQEILKYTTEGDLRRKIQQDIKRLQEIGSYRGYRHRRNLPARGQRTRTNARTKRGRRITVGSGKKKETKK